MDSRGRPSRILRRLWPIAPVTGGLTALALVLPMVLSGDTEGFDPGQASFMATLTLVIAVPYGIVLGLVALVPSLVLWPLVHPRLRERLRTERGVIVGATGLCAFASGVLLLSVFVLSDMGQSSPGGFTFAVLVPAMAALIAMGLAWLVFRNADRPAGRLDEGTS